MLLTDLPIIFSKREILLDLTYQHYQKVVDQEIPLKFSLLVEAVAVENSTAVVAVLVLYTIIEHIQFLLQVITLLLLVEVEHQRHQVVIVYLIMSP